MEEYNKIFETRDGWFWGLTSQELEQWKNKIIGERDYDEEQSYMLNDSHICAVFVLTSGVKKALFTLHHNHGYDGGCYFSPGENPFKYDRINVYSRWYEWDDYGYAACEIDNRWRLIKITQFPKPCYEVIGEGFSSAEEAMRSIGIEDSERYLSLCDCDADFDYVDDSDDDSQKVKFNIDTMKEELPKFSMFSPDEWDRTGFKKAWENIFGIEIYPDAMNDSRLEDAFKSPDCGECEKLPTIWKDYGYEQTADGVKVISANSATELSDCYHHYLDEESIVWDSDKKELFLYSPDLESPGLAFRGASWTCAKKLKDEYCHLNLNDAYKEIKKLIEDAAKI